MGGFGGYSWVVALWRAWEVLGVLEKEDSELMCSKLSQGWNIVNKDQLLPALIGSFTKAPCAQPHYAQ